MNCFYRGIFLGLLALSLPLGKAFADSPAQRAQSCMAFDMVNEWKVYSDSVQSALETPAQWWRCFEDPALDSLIDMAVANNYDLRMAARRIEMAKAAVGSARAAYFPQIGLSAGWTKEQSSGLMIDPGTKPSSQSYFAGALSMSWELDVFGKISAQVRAGKEQLLVSRAERAGVMVSLVAEVASDYVALRVGQAQLALLQEHAASQLKVLRIAEARFETGLASMLDVDQARTVYYSTIASIPTLESSIHASRNALALLLGLLPGQPLTLLEAPGQMPRYFQLVQAGVPVDLLRRRPDVIQAEKQIAVAAAQLGIARKDWLPSLQLSGSIATQAHDAGSLFRKDSFAYSFAPTLSWTVFDGLARSYAVSSAKQSMLEAIDSYNLTVLTAYRESDNALSSYVSDLRYIDALNNVVKAAADYDARALASYKDGLSPFINVAQAQISYLENMYSLIAAQGNALNDLISLYKALGGGWSGLD